MRANNKTHKAWHGVRTDTRTHTQTGEVKDMCVCVRCRRRRRSTPRKSHPCDADDDAGSNNVCTLPQQGPELHMEHEEEEEE